jgi:hypothetical protein
MNLQSLSGAEHCYGETLRAVRELEKYRDSLLLITIGYACPLELRHLRYFVAVAEEENVSRAALKLHVSQPGISNQIHDLEDEIGFLLFERTANPCGCRRPEKFFSAKLATFLSAPPTRCLSLRPLCLCGEILRYSRRAVMGWVMLTQRHFNFEMVQSGLRLLRQSISEAHLQTIDRRRADHIWRRLCVRPRRPKIQLEG